MEEEEQKAKEKVEYAGLDIDTGNRERKRESLSQEQSTKTAEGGSMGEETPEESESLCQEHNQLRELMEGGYLKKDLRRGIVILERKRNKQMPRECNRHQRRRNVIS